MVILKLLISINLIFSIHRNIFLAYYQTGNKDILKKANLFSIYSYKLLSFLRY